MSAPTTTATTARVLGPPAHVGTRTAAQSTRGGQTTMYAHVTTTLLQVVTGDPLDLCFHANGFTEFVDLLGLTEVNKFYRIWQLVTSENSGGNLCD